jgi:hypothetical protein
MNKTVLCVLLACATGAAVAQVPAGVDPAAVQRCRIIAESAARLACYDAIALPGLGSRAGWGAPVAAPAGGVAPPAGAAGPAAAAPAAGGFGFEGRLPEGTPDALSSRIVGAVRDFGNGTRFTLDNGQIWQIVDNTSGFYDLQNPPVRIERAVLGSFLMTIEGVNQRPRVRRVR